jgi:hypothetical protein
MESLLSSAPESKNVEDRRFPLLPNQFVRAYLWHRHHGVGDMPPPMAAQPPISWMDAKELAELLKNDISNTSRREKADTENTCHFGSKIVPCSPDYDPNYKDKVKNESLAKGKLRGTIAPRGW